MKITILLFLLTMAAACHTDKIDIRAIDQELNEQLVSFKGIDQKMFGSSRSIQYFQVTGLGQRRPEDLKSAILTFIQDIDLQSFPPKTTQVNLLFYRGGPERYSRKQLFRAAMDTEEGRMEAQKDNLLALIRLQKLKDGKWIRYYNNYYTDNFEVNTIDTLNSDNNESHLQTQSIEEMTAKVENSNCLKVVSINHQLSVDTCYEVDFVEIRAQTKTRLSLTFISGKNAVEADFDAVQSGWISKKVTFFGATSNNSKGISKDLTVSLKDFNFTEIAEQFL